MIQVPSGWSSSVSEFAPIFEFPATASIRFSISSARRSAGWARTPRTEKSVLPSMTTSAWSKSLLSSSAAAASLLAATAFGLSWPKTGIPLSAAKARTIKKIDARMLDIALTPEREAEHVSAEVLQQYERSSEAHSIRQENLTGRPMSAIRWDEKAGLLYPTRSERVGNLGA